MKLRTFALMLAAVVFTGALSGCGGGNSSTGTVIEPPPSAISGTATLRGTVYSYPEGSAGRAAGRVANLPRGLPVKNASITVNRMDSSGQLSPVGDKYTATTDSQGRFVIPYVPAGQNFVLAAQAPVNVGAAVKTIELKAPVSISEVDVSAKEKTGVDIDIATTFCVEAIKEIVQSANVGRPPAQAILPAAIPREKVESLNTQIGDALEADLAANAPQVNVVAAVTDGAAETTRQYGILINTIGGAGVRSSIAAAAAKGSLRVRVVVPGSGTPVSGATVVVTISGAVESKTTDTAGAAFFEDIEPGSTALVETAKQGYGMYSGQVDISSAAAVEELVVELSKNTANQAPVAKAGPDRSVLQNSPMALDGTGSFDPDGDTITYRWTQTGGPAVTLTNPGASILAFSSATPGSYTFSLTVSDGSLDSEPDQTSVTISAVTCSSDSDCDDGDSHTKDACSGGGTADAACSHQAIACLSDAECDDSNALTLDSCSNPGAVNSSCAHTAITCNNAADCDDDDDYTEDSCSGGGTAGAACSHQAIACLSDAECDDSNALTLDSCSNPGTVNSACAHTAIACNTDTDCDDSNPATLDTCANPSTVLSSCSNVNFCGNGVVDSGEECDDGDTASLDGCSSTCTVERGILDAGYTHSCAFRTGGLFCWGENDLGELGDGDVTLPTYSNPVAVVGFTTGGVSVTAGEYHTCALTTGSGVKCWGANSFIGGGNGQLGDGTTNDSLTPVDVSGLTSGVASIVAGYSHTCAVTTAGGAKCWGKNLEGQLGNGTTANSLVPVDVSGLTSGVAALAANHYHTCALTTSGGVKCWGSNSQGRLGDGTTANSLVPVDVFGLTSGAAAVTVGEFHTCALTTSGGVKCWGSNGSYQFGDGTWNDSLTPVDVSGLGSGVATISAGAYHTCALTTSGGVKCWGYNGDGELGDGSTQDRLTPVDVLGLTSGVAAISAGEYHTCALTTAGVIKCWGYNDFSQLGDGTTNATSTPLDVVFP